MNNVKKKFKKFLILKNTCKLELNLKRLILKIDDYPLVTKTTKIYIF